MISLPLKHRPQRFEDLIGQPLLVRYLKSISKKKIAKSLIFFGGYGCGKTSSARIYAKSLNCLSPVDGSPCFICDSCKENLTLEVDASTAGAKENLLALLEVAKNPPLLGQYRVIILDEVQNMSKAAWDSLLKPIEEPKPFQVFILCTTEVEKIRPSIRSRCQQLEVKNLSDTSSMDYLQDICKKEGLQYEETALSIITHFSKGSLRDLINYLEQVSYMGDITVENTSVIFNLGFLTPLFTTFASLFTLGTKTFRQQIQSFGESPKKIAEFLKQLSLFLLYRNVRNDSSVETNPAFALIPEQDLRNMWKLVQGVFGVNCEQKYSDFLNKVNAMQDSSLISLEIALLDLHDFLHRATITTTGTISPTEENKTPAKKPRRQFLHLPTNGVVKEVPPITVEEKTIAQQMLDSGLVTELDQSGIVIKE